jgi:hypothetical protein
MNENKKMLKLLYRSFDDPLQEKEQQRLIQALECSPGLRREKVQLETQRQAVADTAVQSFKPFFAERVLARVNALEYKTNGLEVQRFYESLVTVFRRVAIAGAVLSLVFMIYNLGVGGNLPLEEALTLSDSMLQEILAIF